MALQYFAIFVSIGPNNNLQNSLQQWNLSLSKYIPRRLKKRNVTKNQKKILNLILFLLILDPGLDIDTSPEPNVLSMNVKSTRNANQDTILLHRRNVIVVGRDVTALPTRTLVKEMNITTIVDIDVIDHVVRLLL